VAALVVPWLLQRYVPLPIVELGRIWDDVMVGLGWALIATGITVGWLALKSFAAMGTPFDPTARAEVLVTFGLYDRTRNPMYLGAVLAFLGLALATGNVWRLLALAPLVWVLHTRAILPEEAHLDARFGEAWRTYAARVRRWWW
jgi:protein-S-isoprenylcysteine O-methyltransferase Ste14